MKRFFVLCVALLAVVACNDSTGPGAVSSIQATFPNAPLPIGNTFQLNPVPLDKKGNPSTADCVFTFSSSDPSVATVSAGGLITAIADGATTISIETHGKVISAQISVGAGGTPGSVVSSLNVYPPVATIAVGQNAALIAVALDGAGNVVPTTPAPEPSPNGVAANLVAPALDQPTIAPVQVQWTSSAPAIATVNNSGVVTGVSEGSATLTVVADGRTATATVNIVASSQAISSVSIEPDEVTLGIGSVTPLTAVAKNANGTVLTGRVFTWSSSNSNIATVDRDGMVTGVAVGDVTITAISSGISATTTVKVSSSGQGSISLSSPDVSVAVGGTASVSATVRNSSGTAIGGNVTFTSANPSIATVTNNGTSNTTITGVAVGNTTYQATSGGLSVTGKISVSAATVSTVEITPVNPSIEVNQTIQFTAVAKDGSGNVIPGRAASWSSSNSAVVAINASTGVALGTGTGTAQVTATIDGVTATSTVKVDPRSIASMAISPSDSIELAAGESRQLTVSVYDGAGNIIENAPVTYSSSNNGFAIVSNAGDLVSPPGVVTGVAPGRAVITATSGGKSVTLVVRVTTLKANDIQILPPAVCVPLGEATQLVGTVLDAAGNILTGRPIQWALQAGGLGNITPGGLFQALAPGLNTVIATVDGVVRTVQVEVCPATPQSISVTPNTVSLRVNGTQQLNVTVLDAMGNAIASPNVTYTSSSVSVATVSSTGLVTAVGNGQATITVKSGTKTATVAVDVSNAPVHSIVVSPAAVTLEQNHSTLLVPTLLDAQGNPLSGRPVTYQSSDPAVVSVDGAGSVTAHTPGVATVVVSSETITRAVQITVTATPVASVELSGTSLIVGLLGYVSMSEFNIVAKDAAGNVLTDRVCSLESLNPNVLRIDVGRLQAVGLGTARLRAECGGVQSNLHSVVVASVLGGLGILGR